MKNYLQRLKKCLPILVILLCPNLFVFSQEFASVAQTFQERRISRQASENNSEAGKKSLKEILDLLGTSYHVSFNYEDDIIKDVTLVEDFVWSSKEKLDKILKRLLPSNQFKFEKLNQKNYLIYPLQRKSKITQTENENMQALVDLGKPQMDDNKVINGNRLFASTKSFPQLIKGKVKDENDQPLPGVNILVKGTANGTTTTADGTYSINVEDENAVLVISFIGYVSQEIEVGNKTEINISLIPDVKALQEVVVVGYGTQEKRDVTGSIASVKSESITQTIAPSFETSLQGRASGVQITQSSGIPGGAVSVRIRGTSSISGGSDPLYIVDGVPIVTGSSTNPAGVQLGSQTNALSDLNPNDIESIEVLKDASAGAIYGARAGNGVVLITTKRGKSGRTQVTAGYFTGPSTTTNKIKFLNGEQWLAFRQEAYTNSGITANGGIAPLPITVAGFTPQVAAATNVDYLDKILRTGNIQEATVSANGGGDKTTFYTGLSYRKENGILVGNDWERISGRVNIDNKASERLKVGTGISFTYTKNQRIPSGGAFEGSSAATGNATVALGGFGGANTWAIPIYPIYDPLGSGNYFNAAGFTGNLIAANDRNLNEFTRQAYRTLGNIYAEYKIIDGLTFRSEIGLDSYSLMDYVFNSRLLRSNNLSKAEDHRTTYTTINTNNTLTYNKTFAERHNLVALIGSSFQSSVRSSNGLVVQNFANDNLKFPSSASERLVSYGDRSSFSFLSYFTRFNYKFNDRYLVGLSARIDGSSRFGENNRYGFFPAVSAGWILTEESFMETVKVFNYLKLRSSYGLTGNAEIGEGVYLGLYGSGANYNNQPGTLPDRLSNPNLKWEKQAQFDVAIDFGILNNRITGSIGYYDKVSKDMLLNFPGPPSVGLVTREITLNAGSLKNSGIEFTISSKNLTGAVNWTTDLNITHNKSEVLDIGKLTPSQISANDYVQTFVGKPLATFFLLNWAGVNPQTGDEEVFANDGSKVALRTLDQNTALSYRVAQDNKPSQPLFYGGITNNFSYKGFDLSILFTFSFGNYILDLGERQQTEHDNNNARNYREDVLRRWQKPGDITDQPKAYYISPANRDRFNTTRFLHDASYLRAKTVSLGYRLPASILSRLHISSARIYITAQNLFTITDFPGWDPEVVANLPSSSSQSRNLGSAVTQYDLPQVRSFSTGITIGF